MTSRRGILSGGAIAGLTFAALLVLGVLWWFSQSIHYNNEAAGLENEFNARYQKVKGSFDNMWQIIEGKAGVSDAYKDDFLAVVRAQSEGRKGGDVMKFVQEAAPGLPDSLYRDVANGIESQRTKFRNDENELLAVKQRHDDLRTKAPSSWFVGSRKALVYNVISSGRTEKAFETGVDDGDANPFRTLKRQKAEDEEKAAEKGKRQYKRKEETGDNTPPGPGQ